MAKIKIKIKKLINIYEKKDYQLLISSNEESIKNHNI